jgi:two-component system response regulator YesN
MKVLIADDSGLIRKRIRDSLSQLTRIESIVETRTGLETLQQLNVRPPDLAIIDIRMPGLNGIEIIKLFRLLNQRTKIIIFTNYINIIYKKTAMECGADYFVEKSDGTEKLVDIINQISPSAAIHD